ncbi:MAG: outer membrane protein assembly factor BamD [Pyrinomonadaceae bacterium]|nr:outer membrane protein assembly factor BamD [Pyrinomonadaceae bacterium]
MKKLLLIAFGILLLGLSVSAQRNVTPAIDRDPLMEADAKHNLDVAWQAFGPARKAYKQVLLRFEETFAAYPEFSKIDEFFYLAGMSSYYLSENKGKQKVDLKSEKEKVKFAPAKLREDAALYLGMLVEKYPQSKYKAEAETTLAALKGQKSDR